MRYLVKFQKDNGLFPDGILGKNTLLKIKEVFKLGTNEATAHFVGQLAHETAYFKYGEENLNYSASALMRVFGKYFPSQELAQKYAGQKVAIGNRVYANKMGNGDEASGDGYKFRGRGAIQLTGKNNYTAFGDYIGTSFIHNPDAVLSGYYWQTAIWYFQVNNIFRNCQRVDMDSVKKVTKAINGGYNGLDHRYNLTLQYYNMLR